MPVHREDMGGSGGLTLTEETNHGTIYKFLERNSNLGYTRKEIIQEVDIPDGSVGPSLTRLKRENLVEHQGNHWTIHENEVEENTEREPVIESGDDEGEVMDALAQGEGGVDDRVDGEEYLDVGNDVGEEKY